MFLAAPPRRRNLVLNRAKLIADYNRRRASPAKAVPVTFQTPLTSFADDEPTRADEHLSAGEELLFSYYRPSLQGGVYSAVITQDITIRANGGDGSDNKLMLTSRKDFTVAASRFALENGDIAGFYPPQGQGDYNHILPYIIFNDEHLPWIRSGTKSIQTDLVPWLALLVFSSEELGLQPSEGVLPEGKEQDSAGGVVMTFGEIFAAQQANKIASPFSTSDPETIDPEMSAKFVFLPGDVFRSLFCKYNEDGSPIELVNGQTPDPSRYKYLSHCRKINTEGMPEQLVTESGQRLFSTIVSHRTAPVDFTETTSVSVHLVSIENIENVTNIPSGKRVAMCSLHSWTYNVFPAGIPTVQDRLKTLGDTLDILRPPETVIDSLGQGSSMPAETILRLKERARSGYGLVRYRVSTGDQTIAFTRSPFVPGHVVYPMPNLPQQSLTSGTDLQILDQYLGIMDITYASAWQLGKSLAMADRSFTSALVRMRSQVAKEALKQARLELAKQHGHYHTLEDTLAKIKSSLSLVSALPMQASRQNATAVDFSSRRWYRPTSKVLDLSITNPQLCSLLERHCSKVISTFSAATDGTMFAEHNTAVSPDWQHVFSFMLDCLYLYSVPPHYLLPDPEILPEESLRFFAIDKNWTDALIDGALSIANHQLPELDKATRSAIRAEFQKYLDTVDPALNHKPQVPTYGMLLRSNLVAQFPSLTIRAPNPNQSDLRAAILRQTVIADGILLVLFDRVPGSPEFVSLTIQMPPHEQRFSVGTNIDSDGLMVVWKRIYTSGAPTSSYSELTRSEYEREGTTGIKKVYDWPSRTLNMHTYTGTAFDYLKNLMPTGTFSEDAATPVITAIQLNDPLYEMSIVNDSNISPIAMAFGPQSQPLLLMLKMPSIPRFGIKQPTKPLTTLLATEIRSTVDWEQRYTYGMWPVFNIPTEPPSDGRYSIPNDLPYAIDIVFSIIRRSDYKPKDLARVEVEIALGDSYGSLMEKYDGPGGYLASNMRWTSGIFENRHNLLRVGILPREDTNNSSPAEDNKELTFVLRECNIRQANEEWYLEVKEYFKGQDEAAGAAVFFKLVPSSQM